MGRIQTYDILLNRAAGKVLQHGVDTVRQEIETHLGDRLRRLAVVDGDEIAPRTKSWLTEDRERALLIAGGDGSLLAAASQVLETDKALGLLPLGTQNFLARELGFSTDYRQALRQYEDITETRKIDVGQVNDLYFLYGIILDPHSVRFFKGREAFRENRFIRGSVHILASTLGILFGQKTTVRVNGDTQTGRIISVTNNPLNPQPLKKFGRLFPDPEDISGRIFAKSEDQTADLACYVFTGGGRDVFRILDPAVRGMWDEHETVTVIREEAMDIDLMKTDGEAARGLSTGLVIDGEIREITWPLQVKTFPQALELYAPSGDEAP